MEKGLASRGTWRRLLVGRGYRGRFLLDPTLPGPRMFEGRLRSEGDGIAVFVRHPPRTGRYVHQACLQSIDNGWYRLHFDRPPRSWEAAVVFTEEFLRACYLGA